MSPHRKDILPSWLLVSIILALFLVLAETAQAADRPVYDNCPTFAALSRGDQTALVQGFLVGVWAGSERDGPVEILAAVLLSRPKVVYKLAEDVEALCRESMSRGEQADAYIYLDMVVGQILKKSLEGTQEKKKFDRPELKS